MRCQQESDTLQRQVTALLRKLCVDGDEPDAVLAEVVRAHEQAKADADWLVEFARGAELNDNSNGVIVDIAYRLRGEPELPFGE